MLSHFSHVQLFATWWTVAHQAPLSMWFSRQEHWSTLLWPPPRDLPDPGIKSLCLASPTLAGGFLTTSSTFMETLEIPLDCKEIKPVNPKGNQPWIFIGRTDAKAEVPILWLPDAKNQFIGKDPDARKDWRLEEKWMTEDEMAGWHHWFSGHELEQTLGEGEGQGSLVCCHPRGRKELDTT